MAIFDHAAYFDASGGNSVFSVAGAVAPMKAWRKFENEWLKVLARERVNGFHATDFAASQGEYTNWKGDGQRRARFLHDLGVVIKNAVSRFFMISIERNAWNIVNNEFLLEETFHSPYAMGGFSVVVMAQRWKDGLSRNFPIEYIFEDGDKGWGGLVKLCEREKVVPIRLPKAKAIPCQAADLLAWKNRIACTEALRHEVSEKDSFHLSIRKLHRLGEDLTSLNKVLLVPGDPLIYGVRALTDTCKKSNIPMRSSIEPTTPLEATQ